MIANFILNSDFTIAEKFFIEKALELVHTKTIDSNRTRLHSPKTILKELQQVLTDYDQGKIKQFDTTVKFVIDETETLIKIEKELLFRQVTKNYFINLLHTAKRENYLQLLYASNLINDENKDYTISIFKGVKNEILRLNDHYQSIQDLEDLNRMIGFLITEMISIGCSKSYLYKFVWYHFEPRLNSSFQERIEEFEALINRYEENFKIIFKIRIQDENLKIAEEYLLKQGEISELIKINRFCAEFFNDPTLRYFQYENTGHDYISVVKKAKMLLLETIDQAHLGFDSPFIIVYKSALVIGEKNQTKASRQPVFHHEDGYYKNSQELFELIATKVKSIKINSKISQESKLKLISAIRYLRLGSEASELEQKYLNYWIGLEYIFSNYDVNTSTFSRLMENFINIHSLAYIRRNFNEFHLDILRLKANEDLANCNENLIYLTDETTYDHFVAQYSNLNPLLAFRSHRFKELLVNKKEVLKEIEKHHNNLKWHLSRAYRIRNEIVHDAALNTNIELITSNLRYYLTFVINCLIEFFSITPQDANNDSKLTIDDYFILQELKINSLKHSDIGVGIMLVINN